MGTKRKKIGHHLMETISDSALWFATDGWRGNRGNDWDGFILGYPTVRRQECLEIWQVVWPECQYAWAEEHPGRRPAWWWLFSAPRMAEAEIIKNGWTGCYYAEFLKQPRQRLGGVGRPKYEWQNVVPEWAYGIPDADMWDIGEIDLENPPVYESQAAYMQRLGLFLTSAERRSVERRPDLLQPELLNISDVW